MMKIEIRSLKQKLIPRIAMVIGLGLIALGLAGHSPAFSQTERTASLTISQIDASRLPMIEMTIWGRDVAGEAIDFETTDVQIRHAGLSVDQSPLIGQETVGTLTVFVYDTPTGVQGQVQAIEEAVRGFAEEPYMLEYTDYVVMYQVGVESGEELEAPTPFYNGVINFFARPLPNQTGPTALLDSLGGILADIDTIKPEPNLAVSLVVFTDGTDVVSTIFSDEDVIRTAQAENIALHTVLLDNNNLRDVSEGEIRLTRMAGETGGQFEVLSAGGLSTIWESISQFRQQTVLRYEIDEIVPNNDIQVMVSLTQDDAVQAQSTVSIAPTAGLLQIAIPSDQRLITAPTLENGLTLALPGSVGWLDGQTRELAAVQLWSNDEPLTEVDPNQLAEYVATIPNLRFGSNELWLKAIDADGQTLESPILNLTVIQGDQLEIPEALQPPGIGRLTWILGCTAGLFLLAIALWWAAMRGLISLDMGQISARLGGSGGRSRRRRPQPTPAAAEFSSNGNNNEAFASYDYMPSPSDSVDPAGFALDLIDSVTQVASPIGLQKDHVRIGRSSNQSDLVFDQDSTVSRLHATLLREGNTFRIFDENSTSGTYVNSQAVPQYGTLLVDGDEIQLGAVRIRFRIVWDMVAG